MKLIHTPRELRKLLPVKRRKIQSVGFVPTMGYLHAGHLELVRRARKENKCVVVSIFVNPLQFGPKEDFWRYPRNLERDQAMLAGEKTDILFVPRLQEFYASDFQTTVAVPSLSKPLCGQSRPTHFQGVATVVLKLLNLVMPDVLYLGQKDYQQFRVIEQMVQDMDFPARVAMVPIVRESDGLAMSSRNVLLSGPERREAVFLHRALEEGVKLVKNGQKDPLKVKKAIREILRFAAHGHPDYAEIVDAGTLRDMVKLKSGDRILLALAVGFSRTRLIDNVVLTV